MRKLLVAGLIVLAACGQQLPAPECDTNPSFSGSALTCDAAVAVAVSALSTDHPAIERIQFLFGSVTSFRYLYPEGYEQPVNGYIVFTWADDSQRQYVPVMWFHDALTAGRPAAY